MKKKSNNPPSATAPTKIKVVLQGKVESFAEYEARLNELVSSFGDALVVPSAAADGRMCCVINYLPVDTKGLLESAQLSKILLILESADHRAQKLDKVLKASLKFLAETTCSDKNKKFTKQLLAILDK